MSRFPSWMWRNQEVLAFVEWLRDYNAGHIDEHQQAGFYGLDLYSLFTSIDEVLRYLRNTDRQFDEYVWIGRSHAVKPLERATALELRSGILFCWRIEAHLCDAPSMKLTFLGTRGNIDAQIRQMGAERGVEAEIAHDGMEIVLR